ncbi:MAG: tRNA (N(6)-L-threonylcarbamoyladenosine(37)-C(2))-methylthiotransferase MtaB [Clostridiales bacterium]|nr:tRNA (N(6)-L-threonylcarbamoyladenosine(37)-C(2))-methylthiotransferase MtaB [Clostridiales bacterium]
MKKASLHNLGCKVNACETEAMEQQLIRAGYEIVSFGHPADVCVVNTCTVTNIADHKSRQMLHKARKSNPDAIIVAVGCYVQAMGEELLHNGDADIIIGNDRKGELISLIEKYEQEMQGTVGTAPAKGTDAHSQVGKNKCNCSEIIDINAPERPFEELGITHPSEHTRAFLKIQDGCNQFCSYCAIPYARGRNRSRRPEDALDEAKSLAADGFKEIVLTGINLSAYGTDLMGNKEGRPLLDLIKGINDIEGIQRIRLGSLEPRIITEDFVRELASYEKVCPHFHLSLQSGSDTVLRRMNRHYTADGYYRKCEIIRNFYEHPALTTDIIVGFPGETEEEYENTCDFAGKVGFYQIHVFKYSRRDGTPAAKMPKQVPGKVAARRSVGLISLGLALEDEFKKWYNGKVVEVLFEEPFFEEGRQYFTGFTPEYIRVRFSSEEDLRNRILPVVFSDNMV